MDEGRRPETGRMGKEEKSENKHSETNVNGKYKK